jgi:6-phosphogluconolactonase
VHGLRALLNPMRTVEVFDDPAALAQAAARHIVECANAAIAARGACTLALSGGTTPQETFKRLAESSARALDWRRLQLYFSDERCVPPDHPDSNYASAKRRLLDRVAIPSANVHRIAGERDPLQAAADYETEIAQVARFDLILLGLGLDGHTASLFPEVLSSTVLDPKNRERKVLPVHVASRHSWRITLTPRVINDAREVLLLAYGSDKAAVVKDVLEGERRPTVLPAQLIDPTRGTLRWFLDESAARLLQSARS